MQTAIDESFKQTTLGKEAESLLRSCVHCGFCNATCSTYQLLGNELDGPRGRIYLIKQALEGQSVSQKTQLRLDRCLSCLACESTCPSGVRYSHLLEIGREWIEQRVPRPWYEAFKRKSLRVVLAYPKRFKALLRLGQGFRALLPSKMKKSIPVRKPTTSVWPTTQHARTMLILDGCVQPALAPNINLAAAHVLDRLGITLLRTEGCCGAISQHLSAPEEARQFMRRNIDTWWPFIESGAEALVMTASGCGSIVKEYGYYLQSDPKYADKAKHISQITSDISEILATQDLSSFQRNNLKIAFHAPCSLQHGQKITGVVESILESVGFQLTSVPDAHLCCGSAGTYSILQSDLSQQLLANKINALESEQPELIATANIGCLTHLESAANIPVVHWVELLDRTDS
ncbi:MAG TPA: glycolate oxidase iron-sulfur subunit [Gammaproteobacteria bacterium]|nr:glycolate oxidase iron-sulfur subunit [Gammaproteobacteria bacterium]